MKRARIARRAAGLLPMLLGLLTALAPALSHAQPTRYYWYDGGERRSLWLDPARGAEFSADGSRTVVMIKPSGLNAKLSAKASASGTGINDADSPLLRDGQDANGLYRALPGGVIVRLKTPLPSDAAAWFGERGLTPLREIGSGQGRWLLQSDPGLASLELANRLFESGEFASAAPNWWQPRKLK